jgi:hypothetical protein
MARRRQTGDEQHRRSGVALLFGKAGVRMFNSLKRMGEWRRSYVRGVGGALLTLLCVLGCNGNSDTQSGNVSGSGGSTSNQQSTDPAKRFEGVEWDCTQTDSLCTCYGIPPNVDVAYGGSNGSGIVDVLECGAGYACCPSLPSF